MYSGAKLYSRLCCNGRTFRRFAAGQRGVGIKVRYGRQIKTVFVKKITIYFNQTKTDKITVR